MPAGAFQFSKDGLPRNPETLIADKRPELALLCQQGLLYLSKAFTMLAFLEKYNELEIIRYEDFCANPLTIMKKLCEILHLEFNKDFSRSFGNKNLSGDSGRTGLEAIEVRQRRPIPKELEPYIENSKYYLELVQQLGY